MAKKKAAKKPAKKTVKKAVKKTAKKKTVKAAKKTVKKKTKKTAKRTKKTVKKTAKKAAKKKTVKAAKKTVKKKTKKAAKRTKKAGPKKVRVNLGVYDRREVPEEQHFYFVNGHRVKNVKELAEIMDKIEQEVFDYHVNEEKNDFYNWVRHVFDDLELAEKLVGVTGPKHLQFTIYKHVADKALKKRK